MTGAGGTITSYQRQKPPLAYSGMLRKMTARMKQLQDEFALESVTNIEFEESSRRSFEFLTGQVKSLKEAFSTLTDTLLEEIEHLASAMRGEIFRIEDKCQKTDTALMGAINTGEKLGRQVEQLAKDLDAVLGVVPKIEDSMLRSNAHLTERLDHVAHDVSKACGDVEYLQSKVRTVESDLRQELEQKSLKLQRSVTLQLESMSRALIRESDRTPTLSSAPPASAPPAFSSQLPSAGPSGPPFSAQLPIPAAGGSPWATGGNYMQSPSQPSFGGGYNDGSSPHRPAHNTSQQHGRAGDDADSPGRLKAYVPVDIDFMGIESPSLRTSRML